MKNRLISVLVLCCAIFAYSQESDEVSIDDLFLDPVEDVEQSAETELENDLLTRVEERELVAISGYFGGTSGLGIGFYKMEDAFTKGNTDFLMGATADSHITFDVNPHSSVRINAVFESVIDENNIDEPWSTVYIDTFFLEYNLFDTAFFTYGKFETKVGDEFIDRDDGTSLMLSFPTVFSGLNFLANADSYTMVKNENGGTEFDQTRIYYASWADFVFKKTRFTTGVRYQKPETTLLREGFASFFGVKSSIGKVNITSEVEYCSVKDHLFKADLGSYYIYEDFLIGANYFFENTVFGESAFAHGFEAGVRVKSIFNSPFTFELLSEYNFTEESGILLPVLSIQPWKYVSIAIALPYIFGPNGFGIYDDVIDDDDEKSLDLITSELSAFVSVSLKVNY